VALSSETSSPQKSIYLNAQAVLGHTYTAARLRFLVRCVTDQKQPLPQPYKLVSSSALSQPQCAQLSAASFHTAEA